MSDRLFFSITAALAAVVVLIALVWPQGTGSRSPPPFGHDIRTAASPK